MSESERTTRIFLRTVAVMASLIRGGGPLSISARLMPACTLFLRVLDRP